MNKALARNSDFLSSEQEDSATSNEVVTTVLSAANVSAVIVSAAKTAMLDKKQIRMHQTKRIKTQKNKVHSKHSIDSIKRGWSGR